LTTLFCSIALVHVALLGISIIDWNLVWFRLLCATYVSHDMFMKPSCLSAWEQVPH